MIAFVDLASSAKFAKSGNPGSKFHQLTFTTGRKSFWKTTSLTLSSVMNDDCLIWSSSIHYIHHRIWIIQFNSKFDSVKYDDRWLIDLIFLNSLSLSQVVVHSEKQRVWVWIVWWLMIDWFDLPNLSTFTTGDQSFEKTKSLSLSSLMINCWLIWSS